MSLSPSVMENAIYAALQANTAITYPATVVAMQDFHHLLAKSIATAVVATLVASAVVNPTALVAPAGGGPVTGTGTIS